MAELKCPARTRGVPAACRSCLVVPGGANDLCLWMVDVHRQEEAQRREVAGLKAEITRMSALLAECGGGVE